jgi:predicted dehydrogenase
MSKSPGIVRAAVLGLGYIGTQHLRTLAGLPDVAIVAVSDVDPAKLGSARASLPVTVKGYERWEELLAEADCDALFVCTPPNYHALPAIAAMERGIHVFIEKPIARRGGDADKLVAAAHRSGTVCAVGYQWRAIDFLEEMRNELVGQPLGLLAGRSIGPAVSRNWFVDWNSGGGILFELASHDIDLQRAIAGEVVEVQAAATDAPISDEPSPGFRSVLSITMRFSSGALGSIGVACCSRAVRPSWALDVVSAQGTFFLKLDPHFSMTAVSKGREIERTARRSPKEANIARFVEAVRSVDPGLVFCGPEDGGRTLAVVLACEKALATGGTVRVAAGAQW